MDTSLTSTRLTRLTRLTRIFEQISRDNGLPQVLRSDNGPDSR